MYASPSVRLLSCRFALIAAAVCLATDDVCAKDPLHQRIDRVFDETAIGPVAGPVSDLTFARRIYLDTTGRIPSIEETRSLLADKSPDRRTQLVDRLLNSDDFSRHMATVFDVMLMERRGGKHIKSAEFRAWLQQCFEQDKPFNQLAAELIVADTSKGKNPAAAFLLERDVEPNLLTREISRMLFGMDLQCAQCHDHPNVADYKQEDYHGVFAFMSRSSLLQPDKKKPAKISESADGVSPFKSVFTERESFTAPRVPGEVEITEPVMPAGEEYKVRPTKTVAGAPKFSLRQKLAEVMQRGENPYFRRNIANRLWAQVMGRGLVHPVDMHHSSNPPSNPQLMDLLAEEFAAMNFQVKPFLRELLLTEIYQRSHRIEDSTTVQREALAVAIQKLEQQRKAANEESAKLDVQAEEALELLDAAIVKAEPVRAAWAKARAAATAAATKRDAAATARQAKQAALTAKQNVASTLADALTQAQAAAELLKDTESLAGPLATLKSRGDKVTAETAKLQKELDAATKAETAAEAVLAKSNAAEIAEREKLTPLKETMRQHRAILVKSWTASERAYERVVHAEKESAFVESLQTISETARQLPLTVANAEKAQQQKLTASEAASAAEQQMATVRKTMADAEATVQTTQQHMKQLAAQLSQRQQASQALSESLSNLNAAAAALSDESLNAVAQTIAASSTRTAAIMGQTQAEIDQTNQELADSEKQIEQLKATADTLQQHADAAGKKAADAAKQLDELKKQLAALQAQADESHTVVTEGATNQFHQAPIESLSAEQLAWSILQTTGQIDIHIAVELAKQNKAKPLTVEQQMDPAVVSKRHAEAKAAAFKTLQATVTSFVALFAAEAGQPQDDFFATVDQALYFANGGPVRSWLNPSGNNLTGRLVKLETPAELAEELYLATLVRKPTTEEIDDIANYLAARGDAKNEAVQELAWGLITSAEFRFQY